MKVVINGEEYSFENNILLTEVLEKLNIPANNIIAEINGAVVTKDKFKNTVITDKSIIELIRFVGGG